MQTPCYLLNSKPKDYTTIKMSPLRYCHNRESIFKQVTLSLHKRMQGEECLTAAFYHRSSSIYKFYKDHFYHIKQNTYADDHQIYYSDTNPVALQQCLCKGVETAKFSLSVTTERGKTGVVATDIIILKYTNCSSRSLHH